MNNYLAVTMTDNEIKAMSMLGLAHIGDAVFELMVRTWLCQSGHATAKRLHSATVQHVSAGAQAKAAQKLLPFFTEEEAGVYRRGRNTRVNTVPRGRTLREYHAATGFEALFGYLYLKGRTERLNELFEMIINDEGEGR